MYRRIKKYFLDLKQIRIFKVILRRLVLPGFDGLSLSDVLSFFFRGLNNGSVTLRAAALSFNFFLSLFPTIIFFFTLIPYIPIDGFQETLMLTLQNILPKEAFELSNNALNDIVHRQNGGLLSLGFILAMFFSTNGIIAVMNAFNASFHAVENRKYFKKRLIALVLVLIISVLVIASITLIITVTWTSKQLLLQGILKPGFSLYALAIFKWVIVVMMLFLTISFLYYIAPAKSDKYRFISAGSTLATLLAVITSLGFNYYIAHFSSYNKLYGSIGALIIFMMWIYINSLVILLGFELNTSITQARKKKM
jgi:membrane protein